MEQEQKSKKGRKPGIYELAADIRERIAEMHKEGMSLLEIAEKLTEENVETARNAKWHEATIKVILNQMGLETGRYKVPEDTKEKILDLHKQGHSTYRIALILTEEGVPNSRGKPKWYPRTVGRIINRKLTPTSSRKPR
ncbi:MAG: recombinase family protein [Deltaproteobacteria bacterium]|nr:recombinase family protein [Deltaproteobacteria bacterium]